VTVQLSTPEVVTRAGRPYVAIGATVTMESFGEVVPPLLGEVLAWAEDHAQPAGPPFVRYLVITMARAMVIEVGVPVVEPVLGAGRVEAGLLPAGRYLRATHTGPFDRLVEATGQFLDWAAEHRLEFDAWGTDEGHAWSARLEHYPTDPVAEPDPTRWETVLEFRLSD
jgi:effector-binding domain-containing protein